MARVNVWPLPVWYKNTWWTYLWNLVLPAASMLLVSRWIDWRRGPVLAEELRGLVYAKHDDLPQLREVMGKRLESLQGTWLQKTLIEAPIRPEHPFPVGEGGPPLHKRPGVWIGLYLAVACYLLFVVLW